MNQPDRAEAITLPFGVKKLVITEDTRLPNAVTIEIQREDHTLAGLLKSALLRDPRVVFAGYKMPHPLEHHILFKLQTTDQIKPTEALRTAIEGLINDLANLKNHFNEQVQRAKDAAVGANQFNDQEMDY
ncbi:DNA-directed RNA polymerase II core subunit [Blastocladiella emersonii ATCC 22665]|nr:DNA-directed RNA polymerase II core subunit [Blastocladiella emersonii ATCC 22665]